MCRRSIKDLDGIRLSMLSAIRDQETALARKLQHGDSVVAEATAVSLAGLYRSTARLEEAIETLGQGDVLSSGEGPPSPRDIALRAAALAEPEDVLQMKIVPVAEVVANIQRWTPTLGAELESITTEHEHQAGTVISSEQADRLESNPDLDIVKIPGKIVATIKPGRRQKCRVVACGNYLQRPKERKSPTLDRRDIYSAGLDTISLRSQIATAAHKRWIGATIDVKTAFLTAPYQPPRAQLKIGATIDVKTAFLTAPYQPPRAQLKEKKKRIVLVRAPRVMVLAGLVPPGGSKWKVPYMDVLQIWADASFAQADARSQTGVMITLNLQPLAWISVQQPYVALSTCESKLVASTKGMSLGQALEPLIAELTGLDLRVSLFSDNVACAAILTFPGGSWRTRHLRLRSHAIRERVDEGSLEVMHFQDRICLETA